MTKLVTVTILNEIDCVIDGLDPEHSKFFSDSYSPFAANYRFNPKFKLGSWDGKIRFYTTGGNTYVYLLEEILPSIKKLGYKIKINDHRVSDAYLQPEHVKADRFAHICDPDSGEPYMFRDYQLRVINNLIDNGCGVGLAATSAGKTFITAGLIDAYEQVGGTSVVIVPSVDLVKQTIRELEMWGLDVGEYSGEKKDLNHPHVVSTWQALQNSPEIISSRSLILIDECHGTKANVLKNIIAKHGKNVPHRMGITGTLPKDNCDKLTIKTMLGPVVAEVGAKELIDRGFLATLEITRYTMEEDLKAQYEEYKEAQKISLEPVLPYAAFKKSYFPDYRSEKAFVSKNKRRMRAIADIIIKRSMYGNVFVLVDNVDFGKNLSAMIDGSVFLYGKNPTEERQAVYEEFKKRNDMIVIANAKIASTGLSIKRINELFLIDLGKSFIKIIQSIGRGLRKAVDKQHVNVHDIGTDLKYGHQHALERGRHYKEAQYPSKKTTVDYSQIAQI